MRILLIGGTGFVVGGTGGEVGGTDGGGEVGGDYVGGTEVLPVVGTGTSGASFGADGEQHGAWIFWIAKVKLFIKAISWDSLLSMSYKIPVYLSTSHSRSDNASAHGHSSSLWSFSPYFSFISSSTLIN